VRSLYFDHNATTPLDPRVRDQMLPWLGTRHGNPSSVHAFGRSAREAVETAREKVAALVGATPGRIVFTASGTEANNAVVFGRAMTRSSGHLVLSAIEHPSIQAAAERLESTGWEVTRVIPESSGCIRPERVLEVLREETALVCLMLANNELGTIQPVAEVASACRRAGIPVLCDAVQAAGKIPVDVGDLDVDYVVLGAHKFHGPLGAAAVWVRPGSELAPYLVGGGQERWRRAGTENIAAIAGFGAAAELAAVELTARSRCLAELRDGFEDGARRLAEVTVHGAAADRLPNTSNVAIHGVSAESLMIRLDLQGIAVSAGAACSSGKVEPSVTLKAIGLSEAEAASTIRLSFGITNQRWEVDELLEILATELPSLLRVSREAG
jgi:cysteine desulfurase